jgi:hypothetical protein
MGSSTCTFVAGGVAAITFVLTTVAAALDVKKTVPLSVQGLSLSVPVTGSIQINSQGADLNVQANAVGSLAEVQGRAVEIARRLPVPTGNCDRRGLDKPNVVVTSIDDAKVTPDGKSAVIELAGHVEVWTCVKLLGRDAKNKDFSDTVRVTAAIELIVVSGKQVGLRLSRNAELETGHHLTSEAARLFVGDLNVKLSSALAGMLDAGNARATLPDLPGAEYTITDAQFRADGPTLTVQVQGGGKVTSEGFSRLLEFLTR